MKDWHSRMTSYVEANTFRIAVFLLILSLFGGTSGGLSASPLALRIVHKGRSLAGVVLSPRASEVEVYAAEELRFFLERATGVRLPLVRDENASLQWSIHLGTPTSHPRAIPYASRLQELGAEGYLLQSFEHPTGSGVLIAGATPRGVLYGVYAFLEICLEQITGLSPVDPEFPVPPVSELTVPPLSRVGKPFYPRRISLAPKSPDWLARHRFNVSGAEGVWSGTGSDDGLGTAVKYLVDPAFEPLQDEPLARRLERREELHARLGTLQRRGIESYLFMYVTGEPTEAMLREHPEWFAPPVDYRDARNHQYYVPFCWSRSETRAFFRELIQALVREYPELTGFHLRSWGMETRAAQQEPCGGNSPEAQEQLWQIYRELIQAAREVRPDVRFLISGYDRGWLKDPDRSHAAQLPPGTILIQKWGVDGEPTPEVGIAVEDLVSIGEVGQQVVVLSHNVEEVVPFWMVEADLFASGVRRYADDPRTGALAGFTLQGTLGLGYLDQLVSGLLNWDPHADHVAYLRNYLALLYGQEAGELILEAVRLNASVLSDYFAHYAHSLAISGAYGAGSAGTASRFWSLIGARTVEDALNLPEFSLVEKAHRELADLHARQVRAQALMEAAAERMASHALGNKVAQRDYEDGRALMQLWERFFASRRALVDAVWLGWTGGSEAQVRESLAQALDASQGMADPIQRYEQFFLLFNYTPQGMRRLLLDLLAEEWAAIARFDWHALDRSPPAVTVSVVPGTPWLTTRSIQLHIQATDAFSGIGDASQMQFQEDDAPWTPPEPYGPTRAWTLTPRDGRHRLAVRVSDQDGNWSLPVSVDVLLDTTPPYGSIRPADPSLVQNQRTTRLHINAFDDMSRVDQIRLSHDGVHWSDPIPYQPLVPWEWPPGDGEKWAYALFRDRAGNWMRQPVSTHIVLDTTPPEVVQSTPPDGATGVDFRLRTVEIAFSEVLDVRVPPEVLVKGDAHGVIPAEVSVRGNRIVVSLKAALVPQERVTLTLLSRLRDSAHNVLDAGTTVTFQTAPALLPGDANRDGRVDANDVRTVIRYWGETGPARSAMGWTTWQPQPVPPWPHPQAAYADTNGDGRVDAVDVLPIAVHWGRERPWAAGAGNWTLAPDPQERYREMLAVLDTALLDGGSPEPLRTLLRRTLETKGAPITTQILPPFPNPASRALWFPFHLERPADVHIRIFDARGQVVKRLEFWRVPPGIYDRPGSAVRWEGTNDQGEKVGSGVYEAWVQIADQTRRFLIAWSR